MSLAQLMRLISPPRVPRESGSAEQWTLIEAQLQTALPGEYKEFITRYGTGDFADFYGIYNPFSDSKHLNLLVQTKILREIYTEWHGDRCPAFFPAPNGILPWACDDNGNFYFWVTGGTPDSWKVATDEIRGDGYQPFNLCMSEFLIAVLEKRIKALAGDYPIPSSFHFRQFENISTSR